MDTSIKPILCPRKSGPTHAGQSFIFNSIISVVIGGVLLTGGYGSVVGIVLGTMTFAVVNQGIFYTGFDANWASLILGVLLLAAVLMNNTFRNMALSYAPRAEGQVMKIPLLKLTDINKSFGPIDVLQDISLEVYSGEVLCLLGDNGAGKSTLIKILCGVHKPSSGQVEMDGCAIGPEAFLGDDQATPLHQTPIRPLAHNGARPHRHCFGSPEGPAFRPEVSHAAEDR